MNRTTILLAILGIIPLVVPAGTVAAEKRCVGRIIIVGNEHTPDWFIHDLLWLHTGDPFVYPELRIGERHLANCGRFVIDPEKGVRPTVGPLKENDRGRVVDILVTVQERPRNQFVPAGIDAIMYRSFLYIRYYRNLTGMFADIVWDSLARKWRELTERDISSSSWLPLF